LRRIRKRTRSAVIAALRVVLLLADAQSILWISVFDDFFTHQRAIIKENKPHPIFAFIDISIPAIHRNIVICFPGFGFCQRGDMAINSRPVIIITIEGQEFFASEIACVLQVSADFFSAANDEKESVNNKDVTRAAIVFILRRPFNT
jgi:hypothetical protein